MPRYVPKDLTEEGLLFRYNLSKEPYQASYGIAYQSKRGQGCLPVRVLIEWVFPHIKL